MNALWDPMKMTDSLDLALPVLLGYSKSLGDMDLLDLELDWKDLSPPTIREAGEHRRSREEPDKLAQSLKYIRCCNQQEAKIHQEDKPKGMGIQEVSELSRLDTN